MDVYYIVTNDGFLKRYYSKQDTSVGGSKETTTRFSATIRNAMGFDSIEEANNIIVEKSIECIIIDQNGIKQIY
ncbi:hypothetical protein RJI07_08070 [Mycoplasmatota bacterium WC30]